ncbi:pilus assembly protein TadG-related protein [Salinibacterium sp. G-O1]|uniref:pilus assembly protein TadG-related protein n=1 Tax=Salinibacterium sp. G-O1 TaxID=3046208 RepID=UPI0024BAADC1|nr:pilus assembly protein TadG-related protein [Salinibacterium sp. G-O1]MDJ0335379.1 pilus assembly protein TadG-related protein [Salinibacterium sp. G-O1]
MRWLSKLRGDERGASAVLVGILMVPIIGGLAISIDVGALYVERAQLQNGADAAALAIAQKCAAGTCTGTAATALSFANSNANDGAANVLTPTFPTSHSVKVNASTREAGSNAPALTNIFASVISPGGASTTTVGASATAEWGSPASATVALPIAVSYCEFEPALSGKLQLIRYDQDLTCASRDGHPIPGGFGWIERLANNSCSAFVDLASASIPSEPGNSYPGACDATFANAAGTTVLIPIFDGANVTHGPAASYHIYAFAAFTITGWKLSGGNKMPSVNIDPKAPKCTGNCRGIQGYFSHWVSIDAVEGELGGPDLGASVVRLIR